MNLWFNCLHLNRVELENSRRVGWKLAWGNSCSRIWKMSFQLVKTGAAFSDVYLNFVLFWVINMQFFNNKAVENMKLPRFSWSLRHLRRNSVTGYNKIFNNPKNLNSKSLYIRFMYLWLIVIFLKKSQIPNQNARIFPSFERSWGHKSDNPTL
jgi:hypothetical protein